MDCLLDRNWFLKDERRSLGFESVSSLRTADNNQRCRIADRATEHVTQKPGGAIQVAIDDQGIDCDLNGASRFLRDVLSGTIRNSAPLIIVSGSQGRNTLEAKGASFVFQKPISVEQAVHTLSAARNLIIEGRLRYHREGLNAPVSLDWNSKSRVAAYLRNVSQGGIGIRLRRPILLSGPVQAHFVLPGTKRRMKVQGEVAWTGPDGNAGIRFVEIKPQAKRHLQLWLERQYFTH